MLAYELLESSGVPLTNTRGLGFTRDLCTMLSIRSSADKPLKLYEATNRKGSGMLGQRDRGYHSVA